MTRWRNPGASSETCKEGAAHLERDHRLGGDAGAALSYTEAGTYGSYSAKASPTVSVRASYAYRVSRRFELGADISYWHSSSGSLFKTSDVLVVDASVRTYLPINETFEAGFSLRAGPAMLLVEQVARPWLGIGVVGGPEVRFG